MSIQLLDCTLRDGGYYSLWDFEATLVDQYSQIMAKLPIEYIEIGYRSIEQAEYVGEFYYSPLDTIRKIRSKLKTSQKIALMLNAKECSADDISKLLSTFVDHVSLIRIATDPGKIEHSLEIAKTLKSFGFEVAINIMYISKINEDHDIYNRIGDIDAFVDYLYLVDSYGSVYPDKLEKIIKLFQLKTNSKLGFHGHNNIELAFINSLRAIECGVEIIDSTILGMGRGAGNLKLELLLTHLKAKEGLNVDLNSLSKLVELFSPLMDKYKWGTNLPYIVSGSYSLPQKDVMDAIAINRYSIASIVNTMNLNPTNVLHIFHYKFDVEKCVIIGGASSVEKHTEVIMSYLQKNKNIVIIHSTSKYINKFSILKNKQLFCVAGDELVKLHDNCRYDHIDQFIFGPFPRKINITIPLKNKTFELKNIDFIDTYYDSPLTISLQTALDIKARNIEFVGFDGYTVLESKKEFYLMQENQTIISAFSKKQQQIISITKTNYIDLIHKSIYSKVD